MGQLIKENIIMCPVCHKRRIAHGDTVCATCRRFIREYIDTGIMHRAGPGNTPSVGDVLIVMRELGVSQNRAVIALGGQP
jgi:hypothetical protein